MAQHIEVTVNDLVPGQIYIGVKQNGQQTRGTFTQIVQDNYVEIKEFGGHKEWLPINSSRFFRRRGPNNFPYMNVPRGSTNTITSSDIVQNEIMVDFHGERNLNDPRYYKATTLGAFQRSENPYTRQPILNTNKTMYRARLVGGKKRKTKKTRKSKKTRRQGRK